MYSHTAQYYDKLYAFKDYRGEAEQVRAAIAARIGADRRLLDVACGAGLHLQYLRDHFDVAGLDLDAGLLEAARERLPGVPLYQADMETFSLGQTFTAITCLFSSIAYLKTFDRVASACRTMARHLDPGGVLVVEPWFTPAAWIPGRVHVVQVDEPELKIVRMSTSLVDGRVSYFDFHYLIGTPGGTEHYVERHELGLFEEAEMRQALESAGLVATHDPTGISGRGLWIGIKEDPKGFKNP
ncbi:MAG TPA: class I SAM-dependent methyltransferase [Anaerolineaceae bacterium]|nr:class I SAM-dependent methyltransferase [Anaerolineaceae bacterium]